MKFEKQRFLHRPDDGIFGDCFPTCLSIVTGIARDDVPHWHELLPAGEFNARYNQWVEDQGLVCLRSWYNGEMTPDDALAYISHTNTQLPFIFSGRSKNGTNHAVVAMGGKIIWDPAIDNSGIVGPMDSEPECYCAEWFLRLPKDLEL